jgi:hypothetical protein
MHDTTTPVAVVITDLTATKATVVRIEEYARTTAGLDSSLESRVNGFP